MVLVCMCPTCQTEREQMASPIVEQVKQSWTPEHEKAKQEKTTAEHQRSDALRVERELKAALKAPHVGVGPDLIFPPGRWSSPIDQEDLAAALVAARKIETRKLNDTIEAQQKTIVRLCDKLSSPPAISAPKQPLATMEEMEAAPADFEKLLREARKLNDASGLRYSEGKVRYDLIPPEWIHALGHVFTEGAKKYADRNWEKGMPWGEMVRATQNHLHTFLADRSGAFDDETGCHHLAHAAWNLLALMSYNLRGIGQDDVRRVGNVAPVKVLTPRAVTSGPPKA